VEKGNSGLFPEKSKIESEMIWEKKAFISRQGEESFHIKER
jgi:hypothetical protein